MNKIILSIHGLCKQFGDKRVLHDVDLQIVQGQFVSLVGPSGCGKTTLFKCILGTDEPTSGTVYVDGKEVHGPNRDVGIVYQKYELYEFLTAEKNVAVGLKWDKTNIPFRTFQFWKWWEMRRKHLAQARFLLDRFKLHDAIHLYASELSGGMRQRVAIAQALIMQPKVLLLDEPFGALDEATREDLQKMLLELYLENVNAKKNDVPPPWTVILVTHELNEAFYVSDRVIALSRRWYQEDNGTRTTGEQLGSTKVWDKCTPKFYPDSPRDFDQFYEAKMNMRRVAFEDGQPISERNENVSFWSDLEQGVGTGVVMLRS